MQTLFSFLQDGVTYVLASVVLLGVLIFVHELGHFLVARWCGVRVETFSLGFGKKLWQKKVGDTVYCVSIIPLGGYVKMFGDQPGADLPEEEKQHSFTHKTVWQRIAVVSAGPLVNLLFAAVIFAAVAMMGQEMRAPNLGDIEPNTPAASAGFRSGDRVITVEGREVTTYEDIADVVDTRIGQEAHFKVAHADGQESQIVVPVRSKENPNPLSLRDRVGEIEGFALASQASIVGVPKDSPLWVLGLRTGDHITDIAGQPISRFRDLDAALRAKTDGPLEIKVERMEDGQKPEPITLTLSSQLAQGGMQGLRLESSELYLAKVVEKSPAEAAGLQSGDRLVALNGKTLTHWADVLKTVGSYEEKMGGLQIDFLRDGQRRSVKVMPQMTSEITGYGTENKRFTVGIMPWMMSSIPDLVFVRTLNPIKAVVVGAQECWEFSVVTVLSFIRLFQNKISSKTVGGLLSIGQAAGETAKLGITKFLTMMGIVSINLFVLNLLPVPVLDGGHLVFYAIEIVKGSPLSLKKMEMAQQVGMMLLMGLMVFALYNDVTRLIFGKL